MATVVKELDVRSLPPVQRHRQIFKTFDDLDDGESFVLVNDHEPKPLLYQFQAEMAGEFEWNALELGPDVFRIEIARRESDGGRTVSDLLGSDHRRLDAIIKEVQRLAAEKQFDDASERFGEFACGLRRHINIEEEVLFPVVESVTGIEGGPTAVMRSEHQEIKRSIDSTIEAIKKRDRSAVDAAVGGLTTTLSFHNMKEEDVLYPMADDAAGDERDRDDLVKRMQAY